MILSSHKLAFLIHVYICVHKKWAVLDTFQLSCVLFLLLPKLGVLLECQHVAVFTQMLSCDFLQFRGSFLPPLGGGGRRFLVLPYVQGGGGNTMFDVFEYIVDLEYFKPEHAHALVYMCIGSYVHIRYLMPKKYVIPPHTHTQKPKHKNTGTWYLRMMLLFNTNIEGNNNRLLSKEGVD